MTFHIIFNTGFITSQRINYRKIASGNSEKVTFAGFRHNRQLNKLVHFSIREKNEASMMLICESYLAEHTGNIHPILNNPYTYEQ